MDNQRPTLVLIEDNQDTTEFIKKEFDKQGIDVFGFASGEDYLKSGMKLEPDVFIIDFILSPDDPTTLNGIELINRIKSVPKLKSIPVIMLSTLEETKEIKDNPYYLSKIAGLTVGAYDVIHKPHGVELLYKPDLFPIDELRNKVNLILSNKFLQDEVLKKNSELESQNKRLTSISHFLTHEIKNKLVVIEGLSRNLFSKDKEQLPEKAARFIKQIYFDATDIRRLTEGYLLLFRQESGMSQVNLHEVGLFEIVDPILKRMEMYLDSKGVDFQIKGFDKISEDAKIKADPFLLSIVFENLFANAVEYGKDRKWVVLGIQERKKRFRFNVWNAGRGIPPEEKDMIFDQFYRSEDVEHIKGTGIGLATVKEIVREHGGKIWAESSYGSWANFIFTIPKP